MEQKKLCNWLIQSHINKNGVFQSMWSADDCCLETDIINWIIRIIELFASVLEAKGRNQGKEIDFKKSEWVWGEGAEILVRLFFWWGAQIFSGVAHLYEI